MTRNPKADTIEERIFRMALAICDAHEAEGVDGVAAFIRKNLQEFSELAAAWKDKNQPS